MPRGAGRAIVPSCSRWRVGGLLIPVAPLGPRARSGQQVSTGACARFVNNLEELCAKRAVAPVSTDYLGFRAPQPVDTVRLVQKLRKFGVEFHDSSTKFKSWIRLILKLDPPK